MNKHDFETRTNMRMEPDRAEFECLQDCGSTKCVTIRGITQEQKSHVFHAGMNKHDFETRTNMRMEQLWHLMESQLRLLPLN